MLESSSLCKGSGAPGGVGRSERRVVNVNGAWQLAEEQLKPGHSAAELEGTVYRDVYKRMQESLRRWLQV
jgi:hypothetical protein